MLRPAIWARYFCSALRLNPKAVTRATFLMRTTFRAGDARNSAALAMSNCSPAAAMWTILTATGVRGQKIDLEKDGMVSVPPARFIQWKAVLRSGDPGAARRERHAQLSCPRMWRRILTTSRYKPECVTRRCPSLRRDLTAGTGQQPHFDAPPPATHDRDSIGVKWSVHDDNDDQMVYSVYYRGDGETRWLLLKDNLTDKFYSFDASLLAGWRLHRQGRGFRRAFAFSRSGVDCGKRERAIRSGHDSAADQESQGVGRGSARST